jgi:hypothetical protein
VRNRFVVIPVFLVLAGCGQQGGSTAPTSTVKASGEATPLVPGVGGVSPVVGTAVEGSGMGGLGQMAKNQARAAAANSSSPAGTDQAGDNP